MVVAKLSRAPYQWSPDADRLAGVSDAEIARRQAERNAAARAELLSEFGALRPGEVPSSATVGQWKRQGLVFTVSHQSRSVYPAFQFDQEGRPQQVVADVLATLGTQSHGWELALWFTSANGLLDGRRPVDLIATNPAAISEAARREAFGFIF